MPRLRALNLLTILAAALASGSALAAQPPGAETSIEWANVGGIADWQASDDRSMYLMDRTGRWYLARFQGICYRLPRENAVAFDTGVTGRFDRFSSVRTQFGSCPVASVVRVDRPAVVGLRGVASAAR
jgi:hypothetical protein